MRNDCSFWSRKIISRAVFFCWRCKNESSGLLYEKGYASNEVCSWRTSRKTQDLATTRTLTRVSCDTLPSGIAHGTPQHEIIPDIDAHQITPVWLLRTLFNASLFLVRFTFTLSVFLERYKSDHLWYLNRVCCWCNRVRWPHLRLLL